MERRGVPAVVVCSEPFVPTAKMMAKLQGLPKFGFGVIPHPVGSLSREGVKDRAHLVIDAVLEILTGT